MTRQTDSNRQNTLVSRRKFMTLAASASTASLAISAAGAGSGKDSKSGKNSRKASGFVDIIRPPDRVMAFTEEGFHELSRADTEKWTGTNLLVEVRPSNGELPISIEAPNTSLERVHLRWQSEAFPDDPLFLGDEWERGYGELEWRCRIADRVMPFYFLAYTGEHTSGYGVKTGPAAMCWWQVDDSGISLWLDVRSGGQGVLLGNRRLLAATVVTRRGEGESPFLAAQAFCRMLCETPRLPEWPVYGGNDWYYAYGKNTHEGIIKDSRIISEHASDARNRPYMIIDGGWNNRDAVPCWEHGNERFPDMPGLSAAMRNQGVRPGIHYRPLDATKADPISLCLPDDRFTMVMTRRHPVLDPSIPEVLERIGADIRRFVDWGYDLIKHDFSTVDIFGHWGYQMGSFLTADGWTFNDRSKTTAEIVTGLYRTIRHAAGKALIIGCNTIGHLCAGIFEIQRTGNDTSGKIWERTRKMGINTLAFRMAQHGTFFLCDADCVGLTRQIPWAMNKQWLQLLAESGTPLFVSASPAALGREQQNALKMAFAAAAKPQPLGEPLDWLHNTSPRMWRLHGRKVEFDWYGRDGAHPYCKAKKPTKDHKYGRPSPLEY